MKMPRERQNVALALLKGRTDDGILVILNKSITMHLTWPTVICLLGLCSTLNRMVLSFIWKAFQWKGWNSCENKMRISIVPAAEATVRLGPTIWCHLFLMHPQIREPKLRSDLSALLIANRITFAINFLTFYSHVHVSFGSFGSFFMITEKNVMNSEL